MFKAFVIVFSLMVCTFAHAREQVTFYTRFPASVAGTIVYQQMIKEMNSMQDKYEFKLNIFPGAGGEAADQRALEASRAGENVIVGGSLGNFTINGVLFPNTFDRDNDFTPIVMVLNHSTAVMVALESPINTIDELVQYLRSKKEAYVGGTIQSISTIMLDAVFKNHYKLNSVKLINYKVTQEIAKGLVQGEVDYTVANLSDSPNLKPLLMASKNRDLKYPNVPTGPELGIVDFDYTSNHVIYIPSSNKIFINNVRNLIHDACQTESVKDIAVKARSTLVCINDTEWLKSEIKRQRAIVERYKEVIK